MPTSAPVMRAGTMLMTTKKMPSPRPPPTNGSQNCHVGPENPAGPGKTLPCASSRDPNPPQREPSANAAGMLHVGEWKLAWRLTVMSPERKKPPDKARAIPSQDMSTWPFSSLASISGKHTIPTARRLTTSAARVCLGTVSPSKKYPSTADQSGLRLYMRSAVPEEVCTKDKLKVMLFPACINTPTATCQGPALMPCKMAFALPASHATYMTWKTAAKMFFHVTRPH
mmetsp:Transcript_71761/g.126680  ORF Transcript_71761/g.126680 Transcript_71761/m.126680 type:complete len:227 (+) Transcript_71761:580-1260(+)